MDGLPFSPFEFMAVTVDGRGQITTRQTQIARQFIEQLPGGVVLEMVAIPAGTFLMGSPAGQGYADEHPQHSVAVRAFLVAKYPVTQEQWQAVMGSDPPYRCHGPKLPSDRISWHDASQFCTRLSAQTGRPYRLPTEAQWEYACRAGTATPFHFGPTITTDLANYAGEFTYAAEPKGVYRHVTTAAGRFPPNAFGLYDMHGNVWEWCANPWTNDYATNNYQTNDHQTNDHQAKDNQTNDHQTSTSPGQGPANPYRVLRGGCWHDPPDLCRSAVRLKQDPNEAEDYFGFRIAFNISTG